MSDKTKEIVAEFEYTKENGDSIHSDLDFDFDVKEQMRKPLHDCLDEWLDRSNGTGGFYMRDSAHCFEEPEKPAKRKPLPDGTFDLTREELEEFGKLFSESIKIERVFFENNYLKINYTNSYKGGWIFRDKISDIKAIAYLLERFNLTEGKSNE